MNLRVFPLLIFLLTSFTVVGQKKDQFGQLSALEKNFKTYEKDTTATAIILNEKGENYFEIIRGRLLLVKKYHCKIKVLKREGLEEATVEIPYYNSQNRFEQVEEIEVVTHNNGIKTFLNKADIYTENLNERWNIKKFTLPNAQVGSILEYSYKIITPFVYNFNGWTFQSDIPKLYSEFNAKIPGNYIYNRSLVGSLKLHANEASTLDNCIYLRSVSKHMSCEVLKYAMKDIPAFKSEEEYMLAPSNYISRIEFELAELYHLDGSKDVFTRSWADVDKEFRTDPDIGRQLKKKSFYEKQDLSGLFEEEDDLTRAKNIYEFTQNHFRWNGEYGIYRDIDVKEAFETKTGNIGEINITLINLLQMGGLKTNLVLLSTRTNGLPKKTHPVISDFNYIIAKVEIDGRDYLLDASNKNLPFGILPFRCLNYDGRVMDFKSKSYWYDIKAYSRNKRTSRIQIDLDPDTYSLFGTIEDINLGYDAVNKKGLIASNSEEDYIGLLEQQGSNELEISDYELSAGESNGKKITENYNFELGLDQQNSTLYIDPFIIKHFRNNPFKLESRNYPIDFGYNRNYVCYIKLLVPEGYAIKELPRARMVSLPGNSANLRFDCSADEGIINLYFNLSIKSPHYTADKYEAIKALFANVTEIQNNSLIVLTGNSN